MAAAYKGRRIEVEFNIGGGDSSFFGGEVQLAQWLACLSSRTRGAWRFKIDFDDGEKRWCSTDEGRMRWEGQAEAEEAEADVAAEAEAEEAEALRREGGAEGDGVLRGEVRDELRSELCEAVRNELRSELREELLEELRTNEEEDLREQLKESVRLGLREELEEEVREELAGMLCDELREAAQAQVLEEARRDFEIERWAPTEAVERHQVSAFASLPPSLPEPMPVAPLPPELLMGCACSLESFSQKIVDTFIRDQAILLQQLSAAQADVRPCLYINYFPVPPPPFPFAAPCLPIWLTPSHCSPHLSTHRPEMKWLLARTQRVTSLVRSSRWVVYTVASPTLCLLCLPTSACLFCLFCIWP